MTEYLTEEEQLQQLKGWLKQYGPSIIAGIVVAIALTTGWHYWQRYREVQLAQASALFNTLLADANQHKEIVAARDAQQLQDSYPRTPYAQLATLYLARSAADNKKFAIAEQQLNWVLHHHPAAPLQAITHLRLAKVLLADNKPTEALSQLDAVTDKNFAGLSDEIRGDILVAQHDTAGARIAYQRAMDEIPQVGTNDPLLPLKYANLGLESL